ncbi:MAG: discoidin domain-containing protein [bacterium]
MNTNEPRMDTNLVLIGVLLVSICGFSEVGTNTAIIKGESVVYGESLLQMDNFAFAFGEDKVILQGLLPGTTYWYRTDGLLGSFTTKGNPPIRCGNLAFPFITKDKALLTAELYNLLPDSEYLVTLSIEQGKEKASLSTLFKTAENNLALNGKVSGTFDQLPADKYVSKEKGPLQRITDGDLSYFNGMAQSQDITQEDQWLLIDLGRITNISTITVFWRALAYSQDYAISLSRDGKDWVVLASSLNADNGVYLRSESGDLMKVLTTNCHEETTNGQGFRYVKLLAKKSKFFHKHINWNFIQIMEVKVF